MSKCVWTATQPALRILIRGGSTHTKPHLTRVAQDIFRWRHEFKVSLTYKWVNRALNSRADELSRPTPTEWRINEKGMEVLRKGIFGINLRVIHSLRLGLPAKASPFDTYVVIPSSTRWALP